MRLFGLELTVRKAAPAMSSVVDNRGGWAPWIREPFGGAWQRGIKWTTEEAIAHHAVYSCVTLIASDIGKLRPKLVERDGDGIWTETHSPTFSPVLRKPNKYQNRIQFIEWWMTSKLMRGNAYALKVRDNRGGRAREKGAVKELHLLDPDRVTVLVGEDGSVFYQLNADNLSGLSEAVTVPASEIIHDRMNCLFHPLVGVSPIFASGMAANVGLHIQKNGAAFFANGSNPSGVLTVPTAISQEEADKVSEKWRSMANGERSGAVPVLPHGMAFQPLRMTAVDAQMIQHLQWSAETVAATFHMPTFKIGIGKETYQNAEIMGRVYYSDCLQSHIEQFELCMDEGLGIAESVGGRVYGVEMDVDTLFRMDGATQMDTLVKGVRGGVLTPNNARKKLDEKPLLGGDTIYLQHQDYPIEALYDRTLAEPVAATQPPAPPDNESDDVERGFDPDIWEMLVTKSEEGYTCATR